ncbi:MAG: hypothetical protein IJ326_07955 [Lachnospiraceae bacterium]|nr:hypothetical protein [Lachnospiraceae bacterium]
MCKANHIDLRCADAIKERIQITIEGENNVVIIEELVEVADKLSIYIADNNNIVHIGRGTTFEETTIAVADCNNHVCIGEDCMFARNTRIMASDFHSIIDLQTGQRINNTKGCAIDNHVWVGYGAVILKNTHIYANSIISAMATVHGIIYANSTYIGKISKVKQLQNNLLRRTKEITWERQRQIEIIPVQLYKVKKCERFDEIEEMDDIIVNLENNIEVFFNKIQGWAIWKGKNSQDSEVYIRCLFRGAKKEMNWVIPLTKIERDDVVSYLKGDAYKLSGFNSYMPALVINNWKNIVRVELIIKNNSECGKKILIRRDSDGDEKGKNRGDEN